MHTHICMEAILQLFQLTKKGGSNLAKKLIEARTTFTYLENVTYDTRTKL